MDHRISDLTRTDLSTYLPPLLGVPGHSMSIWSDTFRCRTIILVSLSEVVVNFLTSHSKFSPFFQLPKVPHGKTQNEYISSFHASKFKAQQPYHKTSERQETMFDRSSNSLMALCLLFILTNASAQRFLREGFSSKMESDFKAETKLDGATGLTREMTLM